MRNLADDLTAGIVFGSVLCILLVVGLGLYQGFAQANGTETAAVSACDPASSPGGVAGSPRKDIPLLANTPPVAPVSASEPPVTVHSVTVTAYCPCERCCGRWARVPMSSRTTASGASLKDLIDTGAKFCAAGPNVTFGTVIDIPGYGRAAVLDRGPAIRNDCLDVFFGTHEAALQWGRQTLDVTIRSPGPLPH